MMNFFRTVAMSVGLSLLILGNATSFAQPTVETPKMACEEQKTETALQTAAKARNMTVTEITGSMMASLNTVLKARFNAALEPETDKVIVVYIDDQQAGLFEFSKGCSVYASILPRSVMIEVLHEAQKHWAQSNG